MFDKDIISTFQNQFIDHFAIFDDYIYMLCTSCNLYKKPSSLYKFVQVATEFHHQINPTCTILLYKLDLKRNFIALIHPIQWTIAFDDYIYMLCTSCNLYKKPSSLYKFVQVATEFHHQINPTCTILLYKLDLKRNFIALIHPIQWTIAYLVGADRPAKRQKKTSCVSTGQTGPVLCTR